MSYRISGTQLLSSPKSPVQGITLGSCVAETKPSFQTYLQVNPPSPRFGINWGERYEPKHYSVKDRFHLIKEGMENYMQEFGLSADDPESFVNSSNYFFKYSAIGLKYFIFFAEPIVPIVCIALAFLWPATVESGAFFRKQSLKEAAALREEILSIQDRKNTNNEEQKPVLWD